MNTADWQWAGFPSGMTLVSRLLILFVVDFRRQANPSKRRTPEIVFATRNSPCGFLQTLHHRFETCQIQQTIRATGAPKVAVFSRLA